VNDKHQIPNTKKQIIPNRQNPKHQKYFCLFEIGTWSLFGISDLEIGI
jgi:hypothetical protein